MQSDSSCDAVRSPTRRCASRSSGKSFLLACALGASGAFAACGQDLADRIESRVEAESKRFPTGLKFTNLEHSGSRALHPDLAVLAPVQGFGLGVPEAKPRPDGTIACPHWGRWTYVYWPATEKLTPDGKSIWSFDGADEPLGLEAEGEYADNEPIGAWTFWYPGGALRAEGSFVAGKVEGSWTFWTNTGEVDATKSGEYVAGERVHPAGGNAEAR